MCRCTGAVRQVDGALNRRYQAGSPAAGESLASCSRNIEIDGAPAAARPSPSPSPLRPPKASAVLLGERDRFAEELQMRMLLSNTWRASLRGSRVFLQAHDDVLSDVLSTTRHVTLGLVSETSSLSFHTPNAFVDFHQSRDRP